VLFLGGHDKVARAVYDGRVQLGAGHDGVIADLANQPGYSDANQVLIRLHRSRPIRSDPIATAIGDEAERMRIRDALIAAGSSVEGQAALARFWGGVRGLGIVNEEAFDTLLAALDALALNEADVLP
jgi:ABC-type phosphate/phosphonate transport system substrate-binding protein